MSKKMKGVLLGSTTPYGVEDDRARLKYQTLMQDYHELQKEVDIMSSRLDAGKQRKMIIAAEVRFLRKRFRYLMKTKALNSSLKEKPVQPLNLHKQTKQVKEIGRREVALRMLPPIPEVRPKKKQYINKEVALRGTTPVHQHHSKRLDGGMEFTPPGLTMTPDFIYKVRADTRKINSTRKKAPFFDLNKKERMYANDTAPSNAYPAFDLNQDDSSSGRASSLPSRAPIFDLNQVSTGDEDFQTNSEAVKYEESKRSLMRHIPNDEVQNDLMLSLCRNAGEGPSRVGKRKISWQDPVALRV